MDIIIKAWWTRVTPEEKRLYHREYYREHYREYRKEVYHWRKEHKMCVCCGHEKAEPGKVHCLECKEKRYKHYHGLPEDGSQSLAELSKARYEERKRSGRCIICGKPCMRGKVGRSPSLKRKSPYCKEHYDSVKAYRQERYNQSKLLKERSCGGGQND